MGALTINRKRSDEHLSFNSAYLSLSDCRFDSHISKKPRLSSMHLGPENSDSPNSIAYRIRQYPAPTTRLRREVHAPCRVHRFGFSATGLNRVNRDLRPKSGEIEGGVEKMGNYWSLVRDLKLKRSSAIDSLRYEVVNVEENVVVEVPEDAVSGDSSVEEVEVIEDRNEAQLVGSVEKSMKNNGLVSDFRELDGVEVLENGIRPSSSSGASDLSNVNMKLDNGKNAWDPLPPFKPGLEVVDVPDSRSNLLKSVRKRDGKLSGLNFQIGFLQNFLAHLRLIPKKQEDTSREPFIPLTMEEEADVSIALSSSNRRKVLVSHEDSNIQITGELLQCLRPGAWLNDEVINVYLELLKEREKREPKKFLRCHFFSTFFYKKLTGGNCYDYKSVRRWTTQKKLGYGLVECDKIFVPIHKEVHWCLAVINRKDQKFQYLDSLKGRDSRALTALAKYYVDEVRDKTGKNIDVTSWKQEYVKDLPEQQNGFDCGVFMIKYADFYSRGLGLCFNQGHMPYFRRRTAKEILRLKAD